MSKPRTLTAAEVTFSIEADPEIDVAIAGAFDSGDEEADAALVEELTKRASRGDVWAWAMVTVTARYGEFTGTSHLGGCSYDSEEDFKAEGGYYPQMCADALDDLNASIQRIAAALPGDE